MCDSIRMNISIQIPNIPHHVFSFEEGVKELKPRNDKRPFLAVEHLSLGPYTHPIIQHMPSLLSVHMMDWRFFSCSDEGFRLLMKALAQAGLNIKEALVYRKLWTTSPIPILDDWNCELNFCVFFDMKKSSRPAFLTDLFRL